MRPLHLFLLVWLASTSCSSVKLKAIKYTVRAADGYPITAYELLNGRKKDIPARPRALVFYVQGSVYETALTKVDKLASAVIFGARAFLVEKRGCYADTINLEEAWRFADKETWVSDYHRVIDSITSTVAADIPVILVGGSEGGDVAAALSARSPRITHLILIGSGGGMSQKQEFRYFLDNGPPPFLQGYTRKSLDSMFAAIESSEDSMLNWQGYPYKRWKTYMNDSALAHLQKVNIPILLVHGTADAAVPVLSARSLDSALHAQGKTNITYKEYEGVDHSLLHQPTGKSHFPVLEVDMVQWLNQHGVVKDIEATIFIKRIKKNHKDLFVE